MENINNIQNLDSIIFYAGSNSVVAASYMESRNYGGEIEEYGRLIHDEDGTIYFSKYPSVRYKERNVNISNLNDLYVETLSYVVNNLESDEIVGTTYIKNNRYNVIYTYEIDLHNNFDNAHIIAKNNLKDFLLGLNEQTFNKSQKYGTEFEVSTIKIDQTYFTWYPQNTYAYYNTLTTYTPHSYIYFYINDVNNNVSVNDEAETLRSYYVDYFTERDLLSYLDNEEYSITYLNEQVNEIKTAYIELYKANNEKEELSEIDYLHSYTYIYETSEDTYIPYIIGGNYYSYIKQSYAPIDNTLSFKINEKLSDFESRYNNDHSIYAYYMYDCNADVKMMLTTNSLGVKESTFKIGFDSKFNKWFDNIININANIEENDIIAKITSYKDNEIFAIFKNSVDRITGDNKVINKDETVEFVANDSASVNDSINILTPYSIDTLDLSPIKTKIGRILDLTENNWIENGLHLKNLILDDNDSTTKSNIEKIFGINELTTLQYLDISNIDKLYRTPAIDTLENLKLFKANNSNIDSFRPHKGNVMYHVELPQTIKSLKLDSNKFVPGTLKVSGEDKLYNGVFQYTPNTTLTNLTLRNIDDELTYKLVYDWYNVLEAENLLDSVIYLELKGINWKHISVEQLINLKHFDLSPDFSGNISLIGSGNYKKITRNEYQNILKAYGLNAFVKDYDVTNKIFKNLNLTLEKDSETFEFDMQILNKSIKAYNDLHAEDDENTRLKDYFYKDTLDVNFYGYYYDSLNNEHIISPYANRAANALLDMIYSGENEFTFIKDVLEDENGNDISNYAYCVLDRSIDTANSDEIKNIKAGDILLFNSNTLMIFFKDVVNTIYEYTKLGSITDISNTHNYWGVTYSNIEHWFDKNNAATLQFIPQYRKKVVDDITVNVTKNIIQSTDEDNVLLTISIPEDIQEAINNGEVENPNIIVESNSEHLTVVNNEDGTYTLIPNYDFNSSELITISVYAEANREDTEVNTNIKLLGDLVQSSVLESNLIINSEDSFVENHTLIISDRHLAEYDYETHTLIIK